MGSHPGKTALAFDTHKAVTALKQAGFEEAQAEAVVTTMGEALGDTVATKADLTEGRAALEADVAAVKADIEQRRLTTQADLAGVRPEMAEQFAALDKQLWLMAVGIVGLTVVTLVKFRP